MEKQIELERNKPEIDLYLLHGNSAEEIFKAYKNEVKKFHINDWDKTKYNPETKQIFGMSHISSGVMNYVLKDFGFEVTINEDNKFGDVYDFIKGKYYAEFNTLCVSPEKPKYERNNGLWKKAMELGEEKFGKVKNKFRINGFYYLPDKTEKGYGVKIVKSPNFEIIENRDLGRDDGVSGVFLVRCGDLCAWLDGLAGSGGGGGRVVLKSRSDASQKL